MNISDNEERVTDKTENTEEKKVEEKEKIKAGAEVTKQLEKAAAKQVKHQEGGKTKQKASPRLIRTERTGKTQLKESEVLSDNSPHSLSPTRRSGRISRSC